MRSPSRSDMETPTLSTGNSTTLLGMLSSRATLHLCPVRTEPKVPDCAQITPAQLNQIPWRDIRRICNADPAARCVAVGASHSPVFVRAQEGFNTTCLWCSSFGSWQHLAWECKASPLLPSRPPLPVASVERRFGWGYPATLQCLAMVQRALWEHRREILD